MELGKNIDRCGIFRYTELIKNSNTKSKQRRYSPPKSESNTLRNPLQKVSNSREQL